MKRFTITTTPLSGLMVIERLRLTDARGFLTRMFCAEEFAAIGWHRPMAQINHTFTLRRGTIRGLHFQHPPHAEMKLINCIRGEVWDVAVDICSGSPTFLQWYGTTLSAGNCRALMIPEGFAHGFQALTNDAELLYCHSKAYHPEAEGGLHPIDPILAIDWPLPATEMSDRDISYPMIYDNFKGIRP